MSFSKSVLLFVFVGSVSLALAGCSHRDQDVPIVELQDAPQENTGDLSIPNGSVESIDTTLDSINSDLDSLSEVELQLNTTEFDQ